MYFVHLSLNGIMTEIADNYRPDLSQHRMKKYRRNKNENKKYK